MTTPQTANAPRLLDTLSMGSLQLPNHVFIANDGFNQISAEEMLASGEGNAVAFGRPFIATPDLPRRFALGAPFNDPDPK